MSVRTLVFDVNWAGSVPDLTDRGLQQTFASLTIRCGPQVLTRHAQGALVVDDVFVPLAPVATWLARCWPELLGGAPPFPVRDSSDAHRALACLEEEDWDEAEEEIDDWLRAHSLRYVGDGLQLPDLIAWRLGDRVSLSWRGWCPGDGIEFLGKGGHVEVPVQEFVDVVRAFIGDVLAQVATAPERSAARVELDRAAAHVRDPWSGLGLRLVANRLGRQVDDLRQWLGADGDSIQRARGRIADAYGLSIDSLADPVFLDSPIAMAARSAGTRFSAADHEKVLALGKRLATMAPCPALDGWRQDLAEGATVAFPRASDGYRRAAAVRGRLGRNRRVDIDAALERLGCNVVNVELDDRYTDGIVLWSRERRALVAANVNSPRTSTEWGRRTMLAHELYHLLFDNGDERFFGEVTSDGTPTTSEPAANAFAAELLLPARYLPKDVSRYWTDLAGARKLVGALCEEFGVGWELAVRQLENHRRLPKPVVDALLNPLQG